MNLKFIRVDYPRLKALVEKIEVGAVPGTGVQPGDLATIAFTGDYNDLLNLPVIPAPNNTVTDYVASYELDDYIYSGFNFNTSPVIRRCKDGTIEVAQGVTNLTTDWTNRLSLTYI